MHVVKLTDIFIADLPSFFGRHKDLQKQKEFMEWIRETFGSRESKRPWIASEYDIFFWHEEDVTLYLLRWKGM